jgi:hypothetical protein
VELLRLGLRWRRRGILRRELEEGCIVTTDSSYRGQFLGRRDEVDVLDIMTCSSPQNHGSACNMVYSGRACSKPDLPHRLYQQYIHPTKMILLP